MCAAMKVSTPFVSSVPLAFPGSNDQPDQEWTARCFHPSPSSKLSLGRSGEEWLLKQLLPAVLPCQRRLPLFPQSKRGYSCWVGGEQPAVRRLRERKCCNSWSYLCICQNYPSPATYPCAEICSGLPRALPQSTLLCTVYLFFNFFTVPREV